MAECIGVISKILMTLGSKAYPKIMFAKNLDSHIIKLEDLKTSVEAALRDADLLEFCTYSQQDVFNTLRSALVELDEFLEEIKSKAQLKEVTQGNNFIKAVRVFFSESNQLYAPFRDAHKLKAIVKRFDAIAKNHAQFGTLTANANLPLLNQNRASSAQIYRSGINYLFNGMNPFDWDRLYRFIPRGKKILLVLDNMWPFSRYSKEKMASFKKLLESNGSQVLLTARDRKVADQWLDCINT